MRPGTRLGTYEIIGSLGVGGMGEVYRARDRRLEREVALKVLPPELGDDPERLERFEREAKSLAALSHPNIVTVYTVEEAAGARFLTMELIEGRTLGDLVPGGGMELEGFLDLAIPLADAVAAAHARGVVHRDLKPSNVMVTEEGRVKVLDFGLARRTADVEPGQATSLPTEEADPMTREGQVLGTLPYMAPEQIQGKPVTPRSDIFSLGVLLYEMATGRRPFRGESGPDLISAILRDEPSSPAEVRTRLPRQLGRIVSRCMEKDPQKRFQTALDVRNELEQLRDEVTSGAAVRVAPPSRRLGVPGMALAAAAAILVAALVLWGVLSREGPEEGTADVGVTSVRTLVALPATVLGATDDDYLSDAIPGSLSTHLAAIEGLEVKAPPSAAEMERFGDDRQRLAELYGVDAMLVSTVTAQPSLFVVNLQLVEPASRRLLWSRQYEGEPAGYLDLVREAADALGRELGREERVAASVTGFTASSEAEIAFRQGQYFSNRFNVARQPGDFEAAHASFLEALELDPGMSEAAAELGWLEYLRVEQGDWGAIERAEEWSERTLESNRSSSLARVVKSALSFVRGQPTETLIHALEAVRAEPRDARAHLWLGNGLAAGGSAELALEAYRRSSELDPLYLAAKSIRGWSLVLLERYEEAWAALEQSLAIDETEFFARFIAPGALLELGRTAEAEEAFEALERMAAEGRVPAELVDLIAAVRALEQGEIDAADAVETVRRASDVSFIANPLADGFLVPTLAALGRTEEALSIIGSGRNPTPLDVLLFRSELRPLHGQPRFESIVDASGEFWEEKVDALEEARRRGTLPEYLEEPLDRVVRKLEAVRAGRAQRLEAVTGQMPRSR